MHILRSPALTQPSKFSRNQQQQLQQQLQPQQQRFDVNRGHAQVKQPYRRIAAQASSTDHAATRDFNAQDSWNAAHNNISSGDWGTFLGRWHRVDFDGNAVPRDGMRAFRNEGNDTYRHWVMTDGKSPGAKERTDGLYMREWTYSKEANNLADGLSHPFGTKDGPMRTRTVAASPQDCITVPFGLPLQKALSLYKKSPPLIGPEMYFRSPSWTRSWSGGPMYSMDGEFLSIFYISEDRLPGVSPEPPFQMEGRSDMPQMRGKLSDDPSDWLPSSWKGTARQMQWQKDGSIKQTEEYPVESDVSLPEGNQLVMLPDLFYMSFPTSIPSGNSSGGSVTLQMGGRPNDTTFCKTTIEYGADGGIQLCTFERFSAAETETEAL